MEIGGGGRGGGGDGGNSGNSGSENEYDIRGKSSSVVHATIQKGRTFI